MAVIANSRIARFTDRGRIIFLETELRDIIIIKLFNTDDFYGSVNGKIAKALTSVTTYTAVEQCEIDQWLLQNRNENASSDV